MISKEEEHRLQKLIHSTITANSAVISIIYRKKIINSFDKEKQSAINFNVEAVANDVIWIKKLL